MIKPDKCQWCGADKKDSERWECDSYDVSEPSEPTQSYPCVIRCLTRERGALREQLATSERANETLREQLEHERKVRA